MEIAVVGLPQSGKSTLFKIMTGIDSAAIFGESMVRGIANIPDDRFDKLVSIFKPTKVTPATVPFVDVSATGEKGFDSIRQNLSKADGFIHIVNCFDTADISEITKRYRQLEDELILSDLIMVENRLERLAKTPPAAAKPEEKIQLELMTKFKELLEAGQPLRGAELSKEQQNIISNFAFLSILPELIVLNISEDSNFNVAEFKKSADVSSQAIAICCKLEAEIATLPPEDQKEFLDSLGIEKPAFKSIIQGAFSQLGRIYYFTVGKDEVRAWVIKENSTAPQAASAIHKDFERGFIRAEVVSFEDFVSNGESMAGAKSAGKFRLEGKTYIVQNGDIISFLFNV